MAQAARTNQWTWERVAGLDVGDGYLAVAEVRRNESGPPELVRGATLGLADTQHLDEAKLAQAIRRVCRRAGLRTQTVQVCLRSPKLLLKSFSYDNLQGSELKSALHLEAEALLQLQPGEIDLDYLLFSSNGTGFDSDPDRLEGFFAAAPRVEIDRCLAPVRKAGLYPVAVAVGCTALLRTAQPWLSGAQDRKGALGLMHVTAGSMDMCVVDSKGVHCYPVTFFTRAREESRRQAYLLESAVDHLKYYQVQPQRENLEGIRITGPQNAAGQFADVLRSKLQVDVQTWSPLAHWKIGSRQERRFKKEPWEQSCLGPAAGLALCGGST